MKSIMSFSSCSAGIRPCPTPTRALGQRRVLAFTSEEIWQSMPHTASDKTEYVILNDMPKPTPELYDDVFESKWDRLMMAKADVAKALEEARGAKIIGKSLGAEVEIFAEGSYFELLKEMEASLSTYFIVSGAKVSALSDAPDSLTAGETGIKVLVSVAGGAECERCWIHSDTVGKNSAHPTLCARCASVLA